MALETNEQFLSAKLLDYIKSHTDAEDEFLARLRADAQAAGIPSISIGFPQSSLLQILLRLGRARDVVEIGTLAGYSAIVMARALGQGGRVLSFELDPRRAEFARRKIAESDVAGRIEVRCGDARALLKPLRAGSIDAVFVDADKASYPYYLQECSRLLRPSGVALFDNGFAFGQLFDAQPTDSEAPAVKAFNDVLASDPRFHSYLIPTGDGMWVAVRRS
ncbi:MAG: O-methyltransferase [Planctomycetota bacterium]